MGNNTSMNSDDTPYMSALSDEQVAKIRSLVSQKMSLDERWAAYGKGYGYAAAGGDLIERVKESVRERLDDLKNLLCKDPHISKIAASAQTGIALSLAFAITGKLVAAQYHDVDVIQLGVLLAQGGLLSICQGNL